MLRSTFPVLVMSRRPNRRSTSESSKCKPKVLSAAATCEASTCLCVSSSCRWRSRSLSAGSEGPGMTWAVPGPLEGDSLAAMVGQDSSSEAIICSTERLRADFEPKRWMRATTLCCSCLPMERWLESPCSHGCLSASFADGRLRWSRLSRNCTKSLASGLMPSHQGLLKSRSSFSTERHTAVSEGFMGLRLSSKGSLPVSS
mmetsp:Transcript_3723/g.10107  ORF Transcript_3723/g.10107 Transcript_3723/m.10107 type:complete len:201 (+) Transcript_3723:2227-2829(+)